MKQYIHINQLVKNFQINKLNTWFDRLRFIHIFAIWALVVILFGVCYHFFPSEKAYLYQTVDKIKENSLSESIYFSFITATTTGFGDIIPFGGFRILALFEVVLGLLLLALVTSKLVSIKQDIILNEIYEISLSEKIARIRSSMFLFRQNLARLIQNIEEGTIKKREINDLYIFFSSLEDAFQQISFFIPKNKNNHFTKDMDPINAELIYNSINQSFERLYELLLTLENHKLEWKKEVCINIIKSCIDQSFGLFQDLGSKIKLPEKTVKILKSQNLIIIENIKKVIDIFDELDKPLEK